MPAWHPSSVDAQQASHWQLRHTLQSVCPIPPPHLNMGPESIHHAFPTTPGQAPIPRHPSVTPQPHRRHMCLHTRPLRVVCRDTAAASMFLLPPVYTFSHTIRYQWACVVPMHHHTTVEIEPAWKRDADRVRLLGGTVTPNIGGRPAQLARVDTVVATLCVTPCQGASL